MFKVWDIHSCRFIGQPCDRKRANRIADVMERRTKGDGFVVVRA